jgi:hypothetical protein
LASKNGFDCTLITPVPGEFRSDCVVSVTPYRRSIKIAL